MRYCALLVDGIEHVDAVTPAANGSKVKEVKLDEQDVHFVGSLKTEQLLQVEWQSSTFTQDDPI